MCQVSTPVTTLSAIIRSHRLPVIDLLKVDVEGEELRALQGVDASHWPLIASVVVEVHNYDRRLWHVLQLLRERGFRLWWECMVGDLCSPHANPSPVWSLSSANSPARVTVGSGHGGEYSGGTGLGEDPRLSDDGRVEDRTAVPDTDGLSYLVYGVRQPLGQ